MPIRAAAERLHTRRRRRRRREADVCATARHRAQASEALLRLFQGQACRGAGRQSGDLLLKLMLGFFDAGNLSRSLESDVLRREGIG